MNFVIMAYSFVPKNGPECFCSTRFASALARLGHEVHVVTMDWFKGVDPEVCSSLLDSRVHVTRVKCLANGRPNPFVRLRYLTDEYAAVEFPLLIRTLKNVISQTKDPILISRASPWASFIVAWHCRKLVKFWVCHFSDPLSYLPRGCLRDELRYRFARVWIKRCLKSANAISLTCESVKRYYHEEYGDLFDRQRVWVTNHIGDPVLPFKTEHTMAFGCVTLAHIGYLSSSRGGSIMVKAIKCLNDDGIKCTLLQCGNLDNDVRELSNGVDFFVIETNRSPDYATYVSQNADVIIIADQDTELGYIPFCPSKFAYQIFSDRPIVVLTRPGSTMAVAAEKYPEAGLFYAGYDDESSLVNACKLALSNRKKKFNREMLRSEFSSDVVAKKFVSNVMQALA